MENFQFIIRTRIKGTCPIDFEISKHRANEPESRTPTRSNFVSVDHALLHVLLLLLLPLLLLPNARYAVFSKTRLRDKRALWSPEIYQSIFNPCRELIQSSQIQTCAINLQTLANRVRLFHLLRRENSLISTRLDIKRIPRALDLSTMWKVWKIYIYRAHPVEASRNDKLEPDEKSRARWFLLTRKLRTVADKSGTRYCFDEFGLRLAKFSPPCIWVKLGSTFEWSRKPVSCTIRISPSIFRNNLTIKFVY